MLGWLGVLGYRLYAGTNRRLGPVCMTFSCLLPTGRLSGLAGGHTRKDQPIVQMIGTRNAKRLGVRPTKRYIKVLLLTIQEVGSICQRGSA